MGCGASTGWDAQRQPPAPQVGDSRHSTPPPSPARRPPQRPSRNEKEVRAAPRSPPRLAPVSTPAQSTWSEQRFGADVEPPPDVHSDDEEGRWEGFYNTQTFAALLPETERSAIPEVSQLTDNAQADDRAHAPRQAASRIGGFTMYALVDASNNAEESSHPPADEVGPELWSKARTMTLLPSLQNRAALPSVPSLLADNPEVTLYDVHGASVPVNRRTTATAQLPRRAFSDGAMPTVGTSYELDAFVEMARAPDLHTPTATRTGITPSTTAPASSQTIPQPSAQYKAFAVKKAQAPPAPRPPSVTPLPTTTSPAAANKHVSDIHNGTIGSLMSHATSDIVISRGSTLQSILDAEASSEETLPPELNKLNVTGANDATSQPPKPPAVASAASPRKAEKSEGDCVRLAGNATASSPIQIRRKGEDTSRRDRPVVRFMTMKDQKRQ